jgi:hypothetical protein
MEIRKLKKDSEKKKGTKKQGRKIRRKEEFLSVHDKSLQKSRVQIRLTSMQVKLPLHKAMGQHACTQGYWRGYRIKKSWTTSRYNF